MKTIRLYTMALTLIISIAAAVTVSGRNDCQEEWKQKMLSDKIAFLSAEISITPEEAQVFWPIYIQVDKERDEAMGAIFKAYRELNEGVKNGADEKEIEALLEKYLAAHERQMEIENNVPKRYGKVLSMEKVAKIYLGEEKFRRHHIRKLHGGPKNQANK